MPIILDKTPQARALVAYMVATPLAEYMSQADQCKEALYLKEKENNVLLNRIAEYENSISSLKHQYNEALRLNVIF